MASESNVETIAIVHGVRADTAVRANGDASIFIKPTLDGDGEFGLTLDELGNALRVLGFNRTDLGFPG